MKLQHLSIIFIIIIIPIILVVSYYISLQIDTINMQTSYNSKLLDATKEAIESFEINTVEWNESYSQTADSKRRDIMASIDTFTTSFANSLGVGGTSKENILTYIPAVAFTLYDGYYIYSPTETKEVIKDDNGVAVTMSESLEKKANITGYEYKEEDEGKILYQVEDGRTSNGSYNGNSFTLNPSDAKVTYSHILKPFSSYSARYKKGNTDIIVNYTLDNYITIYGTVNEKYVIRSGYLINNKNISIEPKSLNITVNNQKIDSETLKETIWYEGLDLPKEFTYIYASDKTKVYFDGNEPFQVSSTGERTNLSKTNSVKYKKLTILSDDNKYCEIFQALNSKESDGIEKGKWYWETDKKNQKDISDFGQGEIDIKEDVSSINYYVESYCFTNWVITNLGAITIGDMQNVQNASIYGNTESKIFEINEDNNPEKEDSVFSEHKREIIKQTLISNLNQAITSYSRNSEGEYKLPVLSETDWDQVLRNVSIITFVQGIPIGLKYYNNYAIATSTANKEYVNPDEIYLNDLNGTDIYYHLPGCSKLESNNIMGYRNIDYKLRSYNETNNHNIDDSNTKYYYKHNINETTTRQACYYCLVQRDLYEYEDSSGIKELAYNTALGRERYNNRTTRMETVDRLTASRIEIKLYNNASSEDNSYKIISFDPEDPSTYTNTITRRNPITGQTTTSKINKTLGSASSRTGYDFKEWNTERDGTGNSYRSSTTINSFTDNVELYAQWEQTKYTVKFIANGETIMSRDDYHYNDAVQFPVEKPTKTGYKFYGWSLINSSTLGNYTSGTVTSNITYYASWVKDDDIGITSVEVSVPSSVQGTTLATLGSSTTFTSKMTVKINTNSKIKEFNDITKYEVTTSDGQDTATAGEKVDFYYTFKTDNWQTNKTFYNETPITIKIIGYDSNNKLINTKEISVVIGISNKYEVLYTDHYVNLDKFNNFSKRFTIGN